MVLIVSSLLVSVGLGVFIFATMWKKRKVFNERFGTVIPLCSSGVLSFTVALNIHFLFQVEFALILFMATGFGAGIGFLFGSLYKYQSMLVGFYHGAFGGMMGTMLSAVVLNPSICSLPNDYLQSTEQNIHIFGGFGLFLSLITFSLLHYSLKV